VTTTGEPAASSILAHAKINLSLRVLAREQAGFHQIETLFCLLDLADEIELALDGADIRLTVLAPPGMDAPTPDLGPPQQNLAVRAAELFLERIGASHGVAIRLTKRIPAGGGLGGGSSDAAAVLRGLNRIHGRPLDLSELLVMAGSLGSDVPFFIADTQLAFAWGRGTRMARLAPLPARTVLLAVPPLRLATAAIYADLAAVRRADFVPAPGLVDLADLDWRHVDRTAMNDFEEVVFGQHPGLAALRDGLIAHGAHCARLTGTGSVVFGLFDRDDNARAAARSLMAGFPGVQFILTRNRSG
jgi:4-diphosphocytidyl-2-C-methyl-D-erythritol kinase